MEGAHPGRPGISREAAERLRRRYPRSRLPRPLLVSIVGVLAAAALAWLIWSALAQSRPAVAADITAWTVQSDTKMAVTLTVDRPDPSIPAVCRVVAQAVDYTAVAEESVPVPAATVRVVDLKLTLTTLRRATSASVRECST